MALLLGIGCSYDWDTLDPRLAEDGSGGAGPGNAAAAAGQTGTVGGASAGQTAVAGASSGVGGSAGTSGNSQTGGANAGGNGGGGGAGDAGTGGESTAGTAGRQGQGGLVVSFGGSAGAGQGGGGQALGGGGGQGGQVVSVGGSAGYAGASGAIGSGGSAESGGAGGAQAGGAGAPSAGGVAGAPVTAGSAGARAPGGSAGAVAMGGTAGAAPGSGGQAGACAGTLCGTDCVDLTADTSHCGECGRGCINFHVDTQVCTTGVCDSICRTGWGNCTQPAAPEDDDGCETAIDTTANCGNCGNVCSGGETCRAGLCAPCAAWGLSALFVVDDAGLDTGDTEALRWLEQGLGFGVTVMDEVTVQGTDAAGMDLVVVSSTVDSGNVTNKFTDVTAPVVTWESYIFDDLKLTGPTAGTDYGGTADQTAVDILDSAHRAAGGLAGTVTVFVGAENMRWGVLANGGVAIASLPGSPSQATVFTFETGAELIDATTAPARRVGLFMDNSGPTSVTPDGVRLVLSSICWAAGL